MSIEAERRLFVYGGDLYWSLNKIAAVNTYVLKRYRETKVTKTLVKSETNRCV